MDEDEEREGYINCAIFFRGFFAGVTWAMKNPEAFARLKSERFLVSLAEDPTSDTEEEDFEEYMAESRKRRKALSQ